MDQKLRQIFFAAIIFAVTVLFVFAAPPLMIVSAMTSGHVSYELSNSPMQQIFSPEEFGLSSSEQFLTTEDGYQVWISEVSPKNPKAVIIYLSGIHQPSVTQFYGHAKLMEENGYASILLEVRGHGKSDGTRVCLGYEETADVAAVVSYVQSQERYEGLPIVLHGVSMGGAAAVVAFGMIEDLNGLIAMSAYSSFEDVVTDTMKEYGVPNLLCEIERPFVRAALWLNFGDVVYSAVPKLQAAHIGDRPALFAAAAYDREVPPVNLMRLGEAAPDSAEFWLRESGDHFVVQGSDLLHVSKDREYCSRILLFMERVVGSC
ncbi:hypothetical protein McpSp1_17850 [Methanocorpusculaceae archaeon Sp1]|nr:hypothetical protein [Methanocorpusculaceae archaeon Sp1]